MTKRRETVSDRTVIREWCRAGGRVPAAVEPVGSRRRHKSVLFRLVGAGDAGGPVIAKLCRGPNAAVERRLYEEVLPGLPLASPRFYASREVSAGIWLFIEDGGATRCDPRVPEHRVAAGRWLARLHVAAARRPPPDLPDRGPAHYLERLRCGRRKILEHLEESDFETGQRKLLESVVEQCDAVETRWGEIEEACARLPRTLVHGDFCRKNVHVREGSGGPELFAMDWEMAGWGVPAADVFPSRRARMPLLDLAAYAEAVREHWPGFGDRGQRQLLALGRVFRNLASIDWACADLPQAYSLPWFEIYRDQLAGALRGAEWAA